MAPPLPLAAADDGWAVEMEFALSTPPCAVTSGPSCGWVGAISRSAVAPGSPMPVASAVSSAAAGGEAGWSAEAALKVVETIFPADAFRAAWMTGAGLVFNAMFAPALSAGSGIEF